MTFRWRYLDASGAPVDGPDEEFGPQEFASQEQAEAWFTGLWRELRASGVDAVTLLHGDRTVYGPMSLHEA